MSISEEKASSISKIFHGAKSRGWRLTEHFSLSTLVFITIILPPFRHKDWQTQYVNTIALQSNVFRKEKKRKEIQVSV